MIEPKVNITKITSSLSVFSCKTDDVSIADLPYNFSKNSYKGNIEKFHRKRKVEIFLSQYLISIASENKIPFEKIKLKNYQKVDGQANWQIALTHNPKQVMLLRYTTKKILSCGIDQEEKFRKINPSSVKLFINETDSFHGNNSLLKLWVIKEACFKAISPIDSSLKSLKQININTSLKTFSFNQISGSFRSVRSNNYITIIANIKY